MGHAAWSWKPISCSSQDPCSGPGGEGGWCEGGLAWLENGISRAGAQSRACALMRNRCTQSPGPAHTPLQPGVGGGNGFQMGSAPSSTLSDSVWVPPGQGCSPPPWLSAPLVLVDT